MIEYKIKTILKCKNPDPDWETGVLCHSKQGGKGGCGV